MRPRIWKDLKGQRFNRLVVLGFGEIRPSGYNYWECLCDCGQVKSVRQGHLLSRTIQSCGCLRYDTKTATTHSMRYTPEYAAFMDAKSRCTNPNVWSYPRYGGRGVEFRFQSVESLIDALRTSDNPSGLRPEGKSKKGIALYSLDRFPNPDGHYELGNVRWATQIQQCANRGSARVWLELANACSS